MADQTPNLSLPFIMPSQAQKHVTHNEAIRRLDILTQMTAESRTLSAPPVSPENGTSYLIPEGASGVWQGRDHQIAAFQDGAFTYLAPQEGWRAYVKGEGLFVFSNGLWSAVGGIPASDSNLEVASLAINTSADETNRLAVRSEAVLFTSASGDMRAVINKETIQDTAALLFQTSFQGHAEIGLTGSNNFHFRVSGDGATFRDSLVLDSATGRANFPMGISQSGVSSDTLTAIRTQSPVLSGPTSIKFDAATNRLSWAGRFVTISAGRGAHFGLDGYFDLLQPAVGTVIPGHGGAGNQPVTAEGILLEPWTGLYYVLPIAGRSTSIPQNFRLASYLQSFILPPQENWILVALHNGDTGEIRLGNGEIIYPTVAPIVRTRIARGRDTFPAFHAYDINEFNGNARLIFKAVEADIGSDYNTETGLFTAPRAGFYKFFCSILTSNQNPLGTIFQLSFRRNGNNLPSRRSAYLQLPSANQYTPIYGAVTVPLDIGDTMECYLTGGSLWTGVDLNYFSGHLIATDI